jgi:serine/threonine protein kinase
MERVEKIGEGSYGIVYSGKLKETFDSKDATVEEEKMYAVKRNFKEKTASWIGNVHEADILARLRGHPFIVEIHRFSYGDPFGTTKPMTPNLASDRKMKEDKIHFVLEHATHSGDSYLCEDKYFSFYNSKIIMVQILLALEFIHSKNLIHRDLKPANILVNYDAQGLPIAKLCDFGMSSQHCKAVPATPGVVTHWYRAPEICYKHEDYDYQSDVWSFGCIMFEFISRRAWMNGVVDDDKKIINTMVSRLEAVPSQEDINYLKTRGGNSIAVNNSSSMARRISFETQLKLTRSEIEDFNKKGGSMEEYLDLLRKCLHMNPKKRITISDALKHPFFSIFGDYIANVRKIFVPAGPGPCSVTIYDVLERKWAINTAFTIFNDRDSTLWYKDSIIFHSLDLFDRYLEWAFKQGNTKVELREKETEFAGRLHTKEETELRFYGCLYIMHKYYSTLYHPLDWKSFFPLHLYTKENELIAENFEFLLVKTVCNYKIFRETFLEMVDKFDHPTNSDFLSFLLDSYGRTKEYIGTIEGLYRIVMKMEPAPVGTL